MLKLLRGVVSAADPLVVRIEDEERPAWADAGLVGEVREAPAYGGELEAISTIAALQAAAGPLGWDAVLAGPGPGIVGSGTPLGHAALAAGDGLAAAALVGAVS